MSYHRKTVSPIVPELRGFRWGAIRHIPDRYCTYCDKDVSPLPGRACPDCGNRTWETGSDSDRSGEAGETGTGSTEGESAGAQPIAQPAASPTPEIHSQDHRKAGKD